MQLDFTCCARVPATAVPFSPVVYQPQLSDQATVPEHAHFHCSMSRQQLVAPQHTTVFDAEIGFT
jgi:hypothetical protein